MGKYRNGPLAATLGWETTAVMRAAGIYGILFTIHSAWIPGFRGQRGQMPCRIRVPRSGA